MKLVEHLEAWGTLFFKRRGSLPTLILLPVLVLSLADFRYPFGSHAADLIWEIVCFFITMAGFALRVYVSGTVPEGTSGRNTEQQRADELNTTGIYSVVRHPLYLANFVMGIGVALQPRVWYVPVITTLVLLLYYERIIVAEEAYLEKKFGDAFRTWANTVPIVLPRWQAFAAGRLPFSTRAALRREFYGFCAVVAIFFVMDVMEDMVHEGAFALDPFWTTLFVLSAVGFFVLRYVKHNSDWLRRK